MWPAKRFLTQIARLNSSSLPSLGVTTQAAALLSLYTDTCDCICAALDARESRQAYNYALTYVLHRSHLKNTITESPRSRHDTEHRINKLELKVAAQDQVIATLQNYLEGLEDVQYSNCTEYTKGFEHYEQKRKKSSRLFVELNASVAALQDQQAGLASKEELQYVHTVLLLHRLG
jgi:hypothetical protein